MILPAPVIEDHCGIRVVRDDLLPGGTKMRFLLPALASVPNETLVYASPAFGYAQLALAHCARALGKRSVIFTAKRNPPHDMTIKVMAAGGHVVEVPFGYLSNVRSKAAAYAKEQDAFLVPFGCDFPSARAALAASAAMIPPPSEVWTVAGSGTLTRALQDAWPDASFHAVIIGKGDSDTGRAARHPSGLRFEQRCRTQPPFPSSPWYDAKGWDIAREKASPGALFWNVAA